MSACRKEILTNGLRVVMQPMPGVRSLAVSCWIEAGAVDEVPEQNGVSHFIEHMLFKGTRRHTARQLAERIESVGGEMDAWTDRESTVFCARVVDEHMELAVDLLADMLLESRFDQTEIDRERGVLLEEIRMYDDLPESLVQDRMMTLVLPGDPLSLPVLGTADSLQGIGREVLIGYRDALYRPDGMVVSAAGSFDEDVLLSSLERHFGRMEGRAVKRELPACETGSGYDIDPRDMEQVHLEVACGTFSLYSPRRYALAALDRIVGGSMSSRLFQEIRENRGLAYAVYSHHSLFRRVGVFGIYAGTSAENAPLVLELLLEEMDKLRRGGVTEAELSAAVEQIKSSVLLGAESSSVVMRRLGKAEANYGRFISHDEVLSALHALTVEELHELALELLDPDGLSLAVMGPLEEAQADRLEKVWGSSVDPGGTAVSVAGEGVTKV